MELKLNAANIIVGVRHAFLYVQDLGTKSAASEVRDEI